MRSVSLESEIWQWTTAKTASCLSSATDPNDMAVNLSLEPEGRNYTGSKTYTSGYIRTSPLVEEVPPVGTDTEQPIPNNLVGSRARYQ